MIKLQRPLSFWREVTRAGAAPSTSGENQGGIGGARVAPGAFKVQERVRCRGQQAVSFATLNTAKVERWT